ncbi:hypothetical protein V5O48_000456 [Marasmius crinis-equi]|uniref:Vacuolar import and degradation protein-domain-containing protein n=1 Tax=Marasmius crinis-equi TaxID=585013 RepID=A0ABR3G110_9AGAR
MPSEYTRGEVPPPDNLQSQVKLCAQCHRSIDHGARAFIPAAEAILCAGCQNQNRVPALQRSPLIQHSSLVDTEPRTTQQYGEFPLRDGTIRRAFETNVGLAPIVSNTEFTSQSESLYRERDSIPSSYPPKTSLSPVNVTAHPIVAQPPSALISSTTTYQRRNNRANLTPSPLTDITRLRVRSQAHHSLYPGATFQGTQKSGRNSYEVTVTIVDVDFASSFLCGYLRICGLTHDWPELTTYFDAEIIGSRYGFLTESWGASEAEDLIHWSRFPAFRHVKNELQKPHLTMCDRDRGAVFMRWKERFLVPDHRVQDISGASFAGFYYVCVDFNPAKTSENELPLTPENGEVDPATLSSPPKRESSRRRRDSSTRRGRSTSATRRHPPPVATMSGFYYHQNSEP